MLSSSPSSGSENSPWWTLLHGHGGWGLQKLRTCCNASSLITGSLTGMGKNQAQQLGTDVHIFHVSYFMALSCQFEPVLGVARKSPRSKPSLSSVSQYAEEEERADSTLEVRLLPDHCSNPFARLGSFLCRPWPRRIAWRRSLAPGGNTGAPGWDSCLLDGTVLMVPACCLS